MLGNRRQNNSKFLVPVNRQMQTVGLFITKRDDKLLRQGSLEVRTPLELRENLVGLPLKPAMGEGGEREIRASKPGITGVRGNKVFVSGKRASELDRIQQPIEQGLFLNATKGHSSTTKREHSL